jgi:inosose dehydratase
VSTTRRVRLGATLITFYGLGHWGLPPDLSYPEWIDVVYADPRRFFDGMLDGMREAGVEGVELAPVPGGWEGAVRAYGDAEGFRGALEARGLRLGSSYQSGTVIEKALDDPAAAAEAEAYTDAHARFVREAGADIIVTGNVQRARFTDGDYGAEVPSPAADAIAGQLDRLGAVASAHGVRFAVHTDAYSVCSRNRDIDRMMRSTDPRAVQLCLDAGHVTLDGGDAVQALADHVDRIPVMHWKDCVAAVDGALLTGDTQMERHDVMLRNFRIFGDGIVDWRRWERVLRDADWTGWAMAENDMAADPVGEIRRGLEFFERELAEIHR